MGVSFALSVKQKGKNAQEFSINSDLDGKQTLKGFFNFVRDTHVSTAEKVLDIAQRQNNFDKNPRVRTDNRFDRPIELVKVPGKIQYFARVDVSLALLRMFDIILQYSPRSTGQYISGNKVFVNGVQVANSRQSLRRFIVQKASQGGFKDSDEIRFINVNPYARRLENKGIRRGVRGKYANKNTPSKRKFGKSRRTGKNIIKPSGAYFNAHRNIRSKFKQVAKFIQFTYLVNGTKGIFIKRAIGPNGQIFHNSFQTGKRGAIGRPYLYPTILVRLDGRGAGREEQVFGGRGSIVE